MKRTPTNNIKMSLGLLGFASLNANLPIVIASCVYRRSRYCPRTMNRTGLKPKPPLTPTLSRRAGEGVSSPRPFGERGRGGVALGYEGQAVIDTNTGQIGFMERRASPDEAISLFTDGKNRSARNFQSEYFLPTRSEKNFANSVGNWSDRLCTPMARGQLLT